MFETCRGDQIERIGDKVFKLTDFLTFKVDCKNDEVLQIVILWRSHRVSVFLVVNELKGLYLGNLS